MDRFEKLYWKIISVVFTMELIGSIFGIYGMIHHIDLLVIPTALCLLLVIPVLCIGIRRFKNICTSTG